MLRQAALFLDDHCGRRVSTYVCVAGCLVSLVIAASAAVWMAGRPALSGWQTLLGFAILLSVGALAAQAFFEIEGWLEQRYRDRKAAQIYDRLQANLNEPFTLYLRPFASTNEIDVETARTIQIKGGVGAATHLVAADRLEFEAEIEKSLRGIGPLVALGQPLEHRGAGRILVEDAVWREAITALMSASRLIVLLPSSRAGTHWEVDRLLSEPDLMAKTVVIDPPDGSGPEDASEYDPAREWDGIRDAFNQRGYTLPEDDRDGRLLWFGSSREPALDADLGLGGGGLKRFAADVLKRLETNSEQA